MTNNQNEFKEDYLNYAINFIRYPDFSIYKRLQKIPKDEMPSNFEEENIINNFTNKYQFIYKDIKTGSFYKVSHIFIKKSHFIK
jgi:hypothetical protein